MQKQEKSYVLNSSLVFALWAIISWRRDHFMEIYWITLPTVLLRLAEQLPGQSRS